MTSPPDVEFVDCGAPDEAADATPPTPRIIGLAELVTGNPELNPPVIHGLLRRREIANIIAPPKKSKSWLALYLASCVALGRKVFNQHQTERGRVLLIDNELHAATLAKRIPAVLNEMGATMDEVNSRFAVDSLRGRLRDLYAMQSYFRALEPGYFSLIVLDALYRFMPKDHDENSNAQATLLYNRLDQYAQMTGAAFLIVHHASKGLQTGKSVTDVGAGAGAISRAADSHLILRDHEEEGAAVMESAVRSWPPSPPVCLRWEWPLWKAAPDLDPAQLKQAKGRTRREKADPDPAPEPPKKMIPAEFAAAYVSNEPTAKELILARAVGDGMSEREGKRLLLLAVNERHVFEHPKQAGKPFFARREPTVFDTRTRAHSPHTPHVGDKSPRGPVGARKSERETGGVA